jgi:hypothetical protein
VPTRAITPRKGYQPPAHFQPSFSQDHVKELAAILVDEIRDRRPGRATEICENPDGSSRVAGVDVTDLLGHTTIALTQLLTKRQLQNAIQIGRLALANAESRKSFRKIANLSKQLERAISQLDWHSLQLLLPEYGRRPSDTDPDDDAHQKFERDVAVVARLAVMFTEMAALIPVRRGARGIPAIREQAYWLAKIYEQFTHLQFQASAKSGRDRAVEFVRRGLKMLSPELTDAELTTATRDAVRRLLEARRRRQSKISPGKTS